MGSDTDAKMNFIAMAMTLCDSIDNHTLKDSILHISRKMMSSQLTRHCAHALNIRAAVVHIWLPKDTASVVASCSGLTKLMKGSVY